MAPLTGGGMMTGLIKDDRDLYGLGIDANNRNDARSINISIAASAQIYGDASHRLMALGRRYAYASFITSFSSRAYVSFNTDAEPNIL